MLKDFSIRKKLTLLTVFVCVTSLVLGTAGLLIQEVKTFRSSAVDELAGQARIFAGLSTAAISFNDERSATEMLAELKNRPHILVATIYHEGKIFASYRREGCTMESPPEEPGVHGHKFYSQQVTLSAPIWLKEERLGTIFLAADTFDFFSRMRQNVILLLSAFAASTLLALILASKLQRAIAEPIQRLSLTASEIARSQNYSLRATKYGEDELGRLTDVFNQMLGRIQAQDRQLKESQERFELAVVGSSDGLWDLDLVRLTTYYSPRCKTMLGYDGADPLDDQASWQALTHPDDVAKMDAVFLDCWTGARSAFESEFRVRARDGSYRWILVRGAVLRDANGLVLRMAGSHSDITARKLSEQELEQANQRLREASRQAGMAEIATGVLHNVGNVLNSVNVSTTLVMDRIRQSKLANLAKVTALLREHERDLVDYLTVDPKGRLLIDYLNNLVDHLQIEAQENASELSLLANNVDHIKQIVVMQQSYARIAGVMERIPVEQLIDDALQVVSPAFTRSGIILVREFGEAPPVFVDKHKILQVLVNLFTNARQSLDEENPAEKRVKVMVRLAAGDTVEVAIHDNGVGIAPENLTRIFQHGFTTKRDGHGFGLHSGANALKEIGGSIAAASPGPGAGAVFTITLPIKPPEAAAQAA